MEHKTYESTYVFSSEQQEEVKKIYHKYAIFDENKKIPSEEETKMEQLRRLDCKVTRSGAIAGVIVGICGAAVHGIGIALIQGETMFALGTVIAIAGLTLFMVSYPVYCAVVKKMSRKLEKQILQLCNELMK